MSAYYTLYWSERTAAIIADACLAEIGADVTRIRVKRTNGRVDDPDFEAISPMKQTPALVLPEGTALCESLAIALTLAERHPEAALLPPTGSNDRALAYRWLMHIVCNIYVTDLRHSYTDRYTSDPDGVSGIKTAAEERWDRAFAVIEDTLAADRPWFLESGFSIVDVYLAVTVCWHYDTPALLARSPKIAAICGAVHRRATLAPLFDLYDMPGLDGL
jgi:GST-like protein